MALITLDGYKCYKDIKTPNSNEALEPIVGFVNTFVENYCNIKFEVITVTGKQLTCYDGIEVLLPTPGIISLDRFSVTGEDILDENLVIDLEMGVVESRTTFPTTRNAIEVDYTYGFATPPADLVIAGYELVSYFKKGNFSSSKTSGNGEKITTEPTLIPPQIRLMLDLYKVL